MMADKRQYHSRQSDEGWFKTHWREFMAWSYGIVCLWDFMLAPIFFAWYAHHTGTTMVPWVPLTTSGGGLYHLAMGAIIGVTSYGKTKEKVTNLSTSSQFQMPAPFPPITVPDPEPAADSSK